MAVQGAPLIDAVWVAAALLLTLFGLPSWRMPLARTLDVAGRIAIAFSVGIVIGGTIMFIESLVGLHWSRAALLVPMSIAAAVSFRAPARNPPRRIAGDSSPSSRLGMTLIFLLTLYTAVTARMTCGDLLYFWGPKAVHFFTARQIDVAFLQFPHYYLMHPDYPPLQPLVYAWSSVITGRMSYWGAVWLAPFYLLATTLAFRAIAATRIGARKAGIFATLLAALLAFGFTAGRAAGGADPMLLMFEVIALAAVTFSDDGLPLAAIAMAGAAITKVEGAAFVVALVIATLIIKRRAAVLTAALPAVILLGSWIAFAARNNLLDSYSRAGKPLNPANLGYILYMTGWQASYRVMWLPWIACAAPLAFASSVRRAALPLLVALMSFGCAIFFYMHEPQPLWWIKASAERVLLTTLASLVVASASASQ